MSTALPLIPLTTSWAALPETLHGIQHLPLLTDAKRIAFDTETTGLKPTFGGLRLLQLAAPGLPVVVIDIWELEEDGMDAIKAFFAVPREYYAHNAVFDLSWLQEHGVYLEGDVLCTMLASRVLENGIPNVRNGLAPAVKRYLDIEISKEEQASDWSKPELSESQRSEERRVGKECRSRWSPYH